MRKTEKVRKNKGELQIEANNALLELKAHQGPKKSKERTGIGRKDSKSLE